MYLDHFNIKELPFTLTPNTDYYCNLPTHQAALNVLLLSLRSGEGFIKIIGEVGSGKTLLCRILLDKLSDEYITAYILNPILTPDGLRRALAAELGFQLSADTAPHQVTEAIYQRLVDLYAQGKRVVLLIDEAQALPDDTLEAIRLLTNLETNSTKLLQIVLFGQPELDNKLNKHNLRQLKQRITFSYYLNSLNQLDIDNYICHRLATSGYTLGSLFTPKARRMLYKASRGIPRLINILGHKAMLVAYGRGEHRVTHKALLRAIMDTDCVQYKNNKRVIFWLALGAVCGLLIMKFIILPLSTPVLQI